MVRPIRLDIEKQRSPSRAPRRFAQCLGIALALCSLLYFVPWAPGAHTTVRWLSTQIIVEPTGPPPPLVALEDGHWARRARASKLLDMYRVATAVPPDACHDPCSQSRMDELKRERAAEIAAWEWRGEGAIQAELDGKKVLAESLRSTGGIIIVGDDTQKQLFDYFAAILPTGLRLETNTSLPSAHSSTLYFDSPSPLLKSLNATGSIPLDRLARPVLSWIEDITLLTRAQLTDIVAEVGELHVPGAAAALTSTYPDGQWAARVAELVGPIGGWRGARNSTVVVSTGARWTADLPVFKGYKDHELIHAFAHGLEHAAKSLTTLPRTQYFFRPIVAPHEHCWTYSAPVNASYSASATTMNTMWSHALLEAQDKMMLEGPRPRGYLPIATRSALRPDAHSLVDEDCLHFEGPAVVAEWAKWVWHDMVMASN